VRADWSDGDRIAVVVEELPSDSGREQGQGLGLGNDRDDGMRNAGMAQAGLLLLASFLLGRVVSPAMLGAGVGAGGGALFRHCVNTGQSRHLPVGPARKRPSMILAQKAVLLGTPNTLMGISFRPAHLHGRETAWQTTVGFGSRSKDRHSAMPHRSPPVSFPEPVPSTINHQ
jgi:hypothetical protein